MSDARANVPALTTVAVVSATIAFAVYATTLLPGVDLGDTGGFQAAVLWPETSARRGYPLYYALARPFVLAVSAANPARGLNLFSAVSAAAAVGLLTFAAGLVTRSVLAGASAGLLLAFSYTFWSQAIIAEVYGLHLALVASCLVALHAWAVKPSTARLTVFFAVYALAFGNHLSMILVLVPFALFLLLVHPQPRDLFRARTVAIAVGTAVVGASTYLPNLAASWTSIDAPAAWSERLAQFWFDTTKADWRESMVLGVASSEMPARLSMWLWDARQQFGVAGLALACLGVVRLWSGQRPWAVLVVIAYALSTIFALTYNVGDSHVFFLPGHLLVAFAVGAAAAPPAGRRGATAHLLTAAVLLYGGWRAWEVWPRVDRHADRRGDQLVARVSAGLSERDSVLLSALDWQSENALLYASRFQRSDLSWTRLADVLPHLPYFVRDNQRLGRDVVLTSNAAEQILAAYGSYFPLLQDPWPPVLPLAASADAATSGVPYVLTLLTPHNEPFDVDDFQRALTALTAGRGTRRDGARYQVWAGVTGSPPTFVLTADRPFDETLSILGDTFTVQMDGWLPFDTFRRGGFGRVLRGREPVLTIERGVSLVWLPAQGAPRVTYAAGLYAPKPRFRIPASIPQQASGIPNAIVGTAAPAG